MFMKAVTKTRIVVGVITLAVILAISLPGLSVLFKDGKLGLNMEIGCESVFEIDSETTEDSLTTNLNESYNCDAVTVITKSGTKALTDDNRTLATEIISEGPQTVKAVDGDGNTVKLQMLDKSTDDDKIYLIRISTSPTAAKTIVPNLQLYFSKGDYNIYTDSSMEINEGNIDITISIPMASFVIAQALGCEVIMKLDIDYVKMMNFKTTANMGNLADSSAEINISGGIETVNIDLSQSKDYSMYLDYVKDYDGVSATINGIPIEITVDGIEKTITIVGNVGEKSLSSMIEESLGSSDNKIVLSNGSDTIEIAPDQVRDIIGLLRHMEGSA